MLNSNVQFFGFKCILFAVSLVAATGQPDDLEPMVIIETKSPVPLSETSPWVTRISAYDLEKRQIDNLADALRSVPGMAVVRTGQTGAQTSLFSRGGESNHVTFLYEGRRLNGGFSGTYNFGELSTLGATSVEILRGSSSSTYGAYAMGGVVYMRSEFPENQEAKSVATTSVDSFNTIDAKYRFSIKDEDSAGNFSLLSTSSENDLPNSEHKNLSGSVHFKKDIMDGFSLNLLGLAYRNELELPGPTYTPSTDDFQETTQFLVSPQLVITGDEWKFNGTYTLSEDELYYYSPNYITKSFTDQEDLDTSFNFNFYDNSSVLFGASYSTQKFSQHGYSSYASPNDWNEGETWEQNSASLSFDYLLIDGLHLFSGVRYDNYSNFDEITTYNFQITKDFFKDIKLFAKIGTGYAPPTALELFGISPFFPGNPDLLSEESKNYEFGINFFGTEKSKGAKLSYFTTRYNNLISGFTPANVKYSKANGLEISFYSQLNEYFSFNSSLTIQKNENIDTGEKFLVRRPELFGYFSWIYEKDFHSFGATINFKSRTKETDYSPPYLNPIVKADNYELVSIFSNYSFSDDILLFTHVDNLFDKKYEEVDGYPALGRSLRGGLRFSF